MSNIGTRSHVSQASRSSHKSQASRTSSASARAKATGKKAILEAEAMTIKRLHQIEELKLQQRKTELKLETKMAKAEVEELAYAQVEERETAVNNLTPRDEPPATIYPDQTPLKSKKINPFIKEDKLDGATLSDIKSEDFLEKSAPINPKVLLITKSEEPVSQLNPDAPEWQKESSLQPTPNQQLNSSP